MKKNTPNQLIKRLFDTEREGGKELSVRSVAIKAGLNYNRLNDSLNDETWNPTFETLEKIGDAMGYSITIRAEKKKNG